MKRKTLTAAGVARVRPPTDPRRRRMDWDSVVPGLALRTTAHGSKSWVLVTRAAGRVRFVTLGKPPGIALPKARELAREALERVARGEDPKIAQRTAPPVDPLTIEQVVAEFMEKWAKLRNRTWPETERIFAAYVIPAWKGRRLDAITRGDVVALLDEIAPRAPIQANRVLAAVKKLMSWALDRGMIETHPAARLVPPAVEGERDRTLKTAELRALWRSWEAMAHPWGRALQLLALTAARRGEVESMTWDEIDLEAGAWTIPAERYKNKKPHLIPLSAPAVAVLVGLPRLAGSTYVFTTRGKTPIRDWSGAVDRATEASGVTGWRPHDVRRTVRTGLAELGVPADVCERVLGHKMPGLQRRYDLHHYAAEKRDALERWGAHLVKLVTKDG